MDQGPGDDDEDDEEDEDDDEVFVMLPWFIIGTPTFGVSNQLEPTVDRALDAATEASCC